MHAWLSLELAGISLDEGPKLRHDTKNGPLESAKAAVLRNCRRDQAGASRAPPRVDLIFMQPDCGGYALKASFSQPYVGLISAIPADEGEILETLDEPSTPTPGRTFASSLLSLVNPGLLRQF